MTTYIYFYGKHEMFKTVNPIIFTLQTTKKFCFLLLQKGEKFMLMFLRALFFGIFCYCVCEFFYFLIRSEGAFNATHQQPTYQRPIHISLKPIPKFTLLKLFNCYILPYFTQTIFLFFVKIFLFSHLVFLFPSSSKVRYLVEYRV
jgi:hypothetical protein